jgi:transposase
MESLMEREHAGQLPPGVVRVLSNGKRQYATEFKAELVRQCLVPGTSVAATGMAHGVNANLLRRWIVLHGAQGGGAAQTPALLPVTLRAAPADNSSPTRRACVEPQVIEIDIHGARVRVHGQVDAQRLGIVLDVLAQRT